MAPTAKSPGAQAQRKGKKKRKGRGKKGPAAGGAAMAKKATSAAADKRKEKEDKEQRERMIQAAKEYLQLWALREQGSGWRFSKVRQTWVLKHLYDEGRVDKKAFKSLVLPYVAGLQGGARERVLSEAQAHVAAAAKGKVAGIDAEDDEDEDEQGPKTEEELAAAQANETRQRRAKKVIKAIS